MTDIERLREYALTYRPHGPSVHTNGDYDDYNCGWCAVLVLIERLEESERVRNIAIVAIAEEQERAERAEAQRDAIQDRLTCMCGDDIDRHPYGDSHSPVSMHDYYRERGRE